MAGIYIHVPFCKTRCNYCDFYKTTQLSKKNKYIDSLIKELIHRKLWLNDGEIIDTIYFGGGTPSLLSAEEIDTITNVVYGNYTVSADAEITLEANPDDLTSEYLQKLKTIKINRLSVGIQSFNDSYLNLMNRRHNSFQAEEAVKNAHKYGFDNISTDLIYGLPGMTDDVWKSDLEKMFTLDIKHLSAYHLTYEKGTAFYKMLKNNKLTPVKEEQSVKLFNNLITMAIKHGFEHYEISNFAKEGFYSRHNTSYWQQKKYIGVGPSAHSYDLNRRIWNTSNLDKYIDGISNNKQYYELEVLDDVDKYNEFIMTGLRTKWGVSLTEVEKLFGDDKKIVLERVSEKYISTGKMFVKEDCLILSSDGIFISDTVISDLMIV